MVTLDRETTIGKTRVLLSTPAFVGRTYSSAAVGVFELDGALGPMSAAGSRRGIWLLRPLVLH